ncbi:MAG: hypothetical protein HQL46_07405 [Gammaproteobacteria bacterium]|nr:hypothetical protein [Gammaproteobacteria bacterium]
MIKSQQQLKQTIIRNCRISDAKYADNYTLCIYLLKMREFYRWEHHVPFGTKLSNDDIGNWLMQRESEWDDLEDQDFSNIEINGQKISHFDSEKINLNLEENNLIYSAGYGTYNKPVFVLADLISKTSFEDYQLYICGKEYARELGAPPGMCQDNDIFIRQESLQRYIWEKYEESHWYNEDNALARALGCYDFKNKPQESVEQMAAVEADTVLYHEIGEIQSNQIVGNQWSEMMVNIPRSKTEFLLRAVKDHLADAKSTLPRLIENNDESQIHFYFANFTAMRREIFPSLLQAYQQWLNNKDLSTLEKFSAQSDKHWQSVAQTVLNLYHQKDKTNFKQINQYVMKNML